MTIFGIIWIFLILWAFMKKDIKYMFAMLLLFMAFQSANVVNIDEVSVGPQIPTSAAFIVKALSCSGGKIRRHAGYSACVLFIFMIAATVVISCIHNGIFAEKLLYVAQLFIYMLCFLSMLYVKQHISGETIYRILRNITIFLLVTGIVQVLTTLGILPLRSILKVLIYNDTSDAVYFHRSYYRRVMSTFMEPSYYSGFLVGAFYYFLSIRKRWKDNYFLMGAILVELVWSMSTTGYVAFVIVGIVFILVQQQVKIRQKIAVLVVAGVGFLVVYFGFYNTLDNVIFSKMNSGSYLTRSNLNNAALRMYEASKLFGVGYKNVRGSSIVYSALAQLGIFGFGAYFIFNCYAAMPILPLRGNMYKYDPGDIGIRYAVLSAFVCQIIACPDLDLCTYWFWIYVMGISMRKNSEEGEAVSSKRELFAYREETVPHG